MYSTVLNTRKQTSHILRAPISKSKRSFNVKSSTYYFHMKTKILADLQICFSLFKVVKEGLLLSLLSKEIF